MRILLLIALGLVLPVSAAAGPITFFSQATTNIFADSLGQNRLTTTVRHNRKSPAEKSDAVNVVEGTASASAAANLKTGELKARSFADGDISPRFSTLYADADAIIGDSFQSLSGTDPFDWNGATASFTLDISGLVGLLGVTENDSFVELVILRPGGLDAYARWLNGEDTFDEWQGKLVTEVGYGLGEGSDFPGWVDTVESFPSAVELSFTPGGDFDWAVRLHTGIFMHDFLAVKRGIADFSNTIGVTYNAPAGVTSTLSASGVFPGTLPVAVPEPHALLLLSLGLIALRRRKVVARR